MAADPRCVPTGSQTVGPFFSIGLQDLIEHAPVLKAGEGGCVELSGQVLDGNGAGVPDAMLEFWSPAAPQAAATLPAGYAAGFRRVGTDREGRFKVVLQRPRPAAGTAPHCLVLVFSRGLLRHLLTRVYFGDEAANATDPVLQRVPEGRRATLVAQAGAPAAYTWNVVLQGGSETVFFEW